MPFRSISEQLIEALKNDDVAQALGKAIAPFITLTVQETVKSSLQDLTKTLKELSLENQSLKQKVTQLTDENVSLNKRLVYVEERVEIGERERAGAVTSSYEVYQRCRMPRELHQTVHSMNIRIGESRCAKQCVV